jgi:hypothetical protein
MAAAGIFVGRLHWDRVKGVSEGSGQFFWDTNLDVITAEAIIWVGYIMQKLHQHEEDDGIKTRIGDFTFADAHRIVLDRIKSETGVTFKNRAEQSRGVYREAQEDGVTLADAFATTVLRCVGCQSLYEPLKQAPRPMEVPMMDWMQLSVANVTTFYTTIPMAYYKMFKTALIEAPDLFPPDKSMTALWARG